MGPSVDADEQFNVGLSVGAHVECINAYADWFIYVNKDEKQFLIQQSKRMLFRSLDCLHARTADNRLTVMQCSSTVVKSPLLLLFFCAAWGDRRHSSPFLRVPVQA